MKGRCVKHPDSGIRKKVAELIRYKQVCTFDYILGLQLTITIFQSPNDSQYDGIHLALGRSVEITIAAPLDRCLGFIAMAEEMSAKKATATRKVQ